MKHAAWLKERRVEKIRLARETWSDEAYGITRREMRGGRVRLTWDVDRDGFIALMALHQLRDVLLVETERELVIELRGNCVAWDEIGWCLGTSGDGARKRHPRADEEARAMLSGVPAAAVPAVAGAGVG